MAFRRLSMPPYRRQKIPANLTAQKATKGTKAIRAKPEQLAQPGQRETPESRGRRETRAKKVTPGNRGRRGTRAIRARLRKRNSTV